MPEVYNWPPVDLVGSETTTSRPGSIGFGLSGTPYHSQVEPTRKLVTARVAGIGTDRAGAGYIQQLKHFLDGKLPIVRMVPRSAVWFFATDGLDLQRGAVPLNWYATGLPLSWTADGGALEWTIGQTVTGTAGTDGWDFVDVTGLPALTDVAFPSEVVRSGDTQAHVVGVAKSDANGNARIWLDGPIESGELVIGALESAAFFIKTFPRAIQSANGNFTFDFELIEVFEDEFAEGFTEITVPWI